MPQAEEPDNENYDVILEKIGVGFEFFDISSIIFIKFQKISSKQNRYYHYFLIFLCGFGWLFDGIELALISFILPELKTNWNLSSFQMGFLGSTVFFGMFIGAIVSGSLSDVFGRRYIFVYGMLLTSTIAVLSAFSPNYWVYITLRFIVSLGNFVFLQNCSEIKIWPKKFHQVLVQLFLLISHSWQNTFPPSSVLLGFHS